MTRPAATFRGFTEQSPAKAERNTAWYTVVFPVYMPVFLYTSPVHKPCPSFPSRAEHGRNTAGTRPCSAPVFSSGGLPESNQQQNTAWTRLCSQTVYKVFTRAAASSPKKMPWSAYSGTRPCTSRVHGRVEEKFHLFKGPFSIVFGVEELRLRCHCRCRNAASEARSLEFMLFFSLCTFIFVLFRFL